MATVGRRNGTKFHTLALCNHLHENLISFDKSEDEFWKLYKDAYREDEVRSFHKGFDRKNFKSVYFAKDSNQYNDFLQAIKCPFRFSLQPRTGYIAMLREIIKGKKVAVTHFSVHPEETRATYYVQPHHFESACHSKTDEIKVIHWLHENHFVDISMCLLDDSETPTFDCSQLQPTTETLARFVKHFGTCVLRDVPSNYNTQELKESFNLSKLGNGFEISVKDEKNN